jgi:hypothetical protein
MALSIQKVTEWTTSFSDFLKNPPRIFRIYTKKLYHVDFFVTTISVRITSNYDPNEWDVSCMYTVSPDVINDTWSVITNDATYLSCNSNQVAHFLCDAVVLKKAQARIEVDIQFTSTLEDYNVEYWDVETVSASKKARIKFENSSFNSSLFECVGKRLKYIYDFEHEQRIHASE